MRARRGWVIAPVLLLAGAAAGAGAVRQHWLSCRGSMLSGSVLLGFADGPDFVRLLEGIDVLAVVAFVVIAVRERPGRRTLWRVALALAASTGVGVVANVLDYAFMTAFSEADWDTPPGSGYPTVVVTALLAVALLVATLGPRRSAPAEALVPADT